MESLAMIIGIVMMVLNLVGIIWLGIVLGHWFLTLIGYIIALGVIANISENIFLIVMIAVSVITLIGIIIMVISSIKDKKINKRRYKLEAELKAAIERKDKQTVENILKENLVNNLYIDTAVESGDKEIVSLLLNESSNINFDDGKLLTIAIKNNDKEMVTLLIEKGANVNLENGGITPLDCTENEEMIALLRRHGAKTQEEIEEEKRAEEVRKRLKAEESRKKYELQTMLNEDLLTAIQRGNFDMVKSLISQGADVNYATMDGNSPLTFAVYSGDIEIIKFLLQKGADPNKKNHVIGGGEISAVTFARYIVKNERLADFLEYY